MKNLNLNRNHTQIILFKPILYQPRKKQTISKDLITPILFFKVSNYICHELNYVVLCVLFIICLTIAHYIDKEYDKTP